MSLDVHMLQIGNISFYTEIYDYIISLVWQLLFKARGVQGGLGIPKVLDMSNAMGFFFFEHFMPDNLLLKLPIISEAVLLPNMECCFLRTTNVVTF